MACHFRSLDHGFSTHDSRRLRGICAGHNGGPGPRIYELYITSNDNIARHLLGMNDAAGQAEPSVVGMLGILCLARPVLQSFLYAPSSITHFERPIILPAFRINLNEWHSMFFISVSSSTASPNRPLSPYSIVDYTVLRTAIKIALSHVSHLARLAAGDSSRIYALQEQQTTRRLSCGDATAIAGSVPDWYVYWDNLKAFADYYFLREPATHGSSIVKAYLQFSCLNTNYGPITANTTYPIPFIGNMVDSRTPFASYFQNGTLLSDAELPGRLVHDMKKDLKDFIHPGVGDSIECESLWKTRIKLLIWKAFLQNPTEKRLTKNNYAKKYGNLISKGEIEDHSPEINITALPPKPIVHVPGGHTALFFPEDIKREFRLATSPDLHVSFSNKTS
ncbi:hypothetical protein IW261DRAFT_1426474 [Armillaria novae-zelandiae]|uniref:Uncharacterized protein n=1 Tax=Armillaria novae-zelandiae TaxID=153914 RepID=A0AA39NLE4_9AGAR|nr:hypothetical protein IW261DRAFT_1426474 [Armillaria novae-zelandiae]